MERGGGTGDTVDHVRLDAGNPVPLHYQLAQRLRGLIRAGSLAPGQMISPEIRLCDQYGVSRPTVRQALQALVGDGLLERRRGVGTFVAFPKVRQQLDSLLGFSERMERAGRLAMTRLIEQKVVPASGLAVGVGEQLAVEPTEPVLCLVRLRLVDGEPHLLQTTHLPLARFPGLDTVDLVHASLYRTLRDRYGVRITYLAERLEPVLPPPAEARLLGISPRQPVMLVTTTTRGSDDQPVEYTLTRGRGDRCEHWIEFRLGGAGEDASAYLRQTQLEITLERANG